MAVVINEVEEPVDRGASQSQPPAGSATSDPHADEKIREVIALEHERELRTQAY